MTAPDRPDAPRGPDSPRGSDSPQSHRAARPAGRRWMVPLLILVVAAALIAAVLWLRPGGDSTEPAASTDSTDVADAPADGAEAEDPGAVEHPSSVAVPDLSEEEARDEDDLLAEGPVDAPVVLIVFTDYQCPYCAEWSQETLPAVREHVDRGELRIEWRDVNIYGDDSERAARASLAAARQDAHAEYHDRLFEGGEIRTGAELDESSLVALADELGLDTEQFTEDLHSEEVAETISANASQGWDLGIMSTPAFVVGGTPMVGAQPTDVFTTAIDDALAESGS